MSIVLISPDEDVPFETLFINFAEKYYNDPESIQEEDKIPFLEKLRIKKKEQEDTGFLMDEICDNLNQDFQKIFAIKQLEVNECKLPNDTSIIRKELDSVSQMMVIENLSIEENISKIVNDRINNGVTTTIDDVAGCHRIAICIATLKNGEKCKNPCLKSIKDLVIGDYCGKHIPPRTRGKWTNINKALYVEDNNIYQTHMSYNPIGSNLILALNKKHNNTTGFKIILEHSIVLRVERKKQTYNLVGLIFHIPYPSSHYVAHVKRGKKWYLVDDSIYKNLEEISSDQVFVSSYLNRKRSKTTLHPCMMFYTKEKTMDIPPVRILQTGNSCFFDSLMDIILGLESVRKWVYANSKRNTRQERQTRRANKIEGNSTKKNRIDQRNNDNNSHRKSNNNDEGDKNGNGNGDGNGNGNENRNEKGDGDQNENGDGNKNENENGDGDQNANGDGDGDQNENGNGDGDKAKNKNNSDDICDKQITFNQRKKGDIDCSLNVSSKKWEITMYDKYNYQNSGRQYIASHQIFQVQGQIKPDPMWKKMVFTPTTYIYIISKTINNETFYKIGEGGKGASNTTGTGRLGNAQTYLIPGSIDAGFLVHYLLFFRKNYHIDSKFIGQHIEKQIHATLQTLFPSSSISFANNNASEWYSIKDKERNFFFGFVFDIIGSFHEKRMKPLEITRVSPDGIDEKIELPSPTEISERMKSNPDAAKVLKIVETFNLRYIRPLNQTFTLIDRNDKNLVDGYLTELRNIYIGEGNSVTLTSGGEDPIFRDTHTFTVTEIKKHRNHAYQRGLNNRLVYATVQPMINHSTIKPLKAIEWKDNTSNAIYYVDIHMFLKKLTPFNNQSDERKNKLNEIYEFFAIHYEKNYVEVPLPVEIYPNYFLNQRFQDACGTNIVNEVIPGKYHNDYSIEIDQNTDEEENDNQNEDDEEQDEGINHKPEVLYSWKVMEYENRMIKRIRWNKETKTGEGTFELIPILRLMKIADVQEIIMVKENQNTTKKPWRKLSWTETKNVEINGQSYEKGDTVEIDDSQFLIIINDMPSTESAQTLTYIITGLYNDKNLDETLNPLMVVKEKKRGEKILRNQESLYTSANPDIMGNHIHMVKPARFITPEEPKYKDGDVIKLKDIQDFYDDIPLLSNNNELAKKWKGVHYVNIISLSKKNYGVSFFSPYDTPTYWESNHTSRTYIIDIRIDKIDRLSKLVTNDDLVAFNAYKNKLPFQITGIESIISHSPVNARKENVEKYHVKWASANGIVLEPDQSKYNLEDYATAQVDLYWKKKSTEVDKYNADHIKTLQEKKKFAMENIKRLRESQNKYPQSLFTLTIDTEFRFKIGDIFWIGDSTYFLCYFMTDLDSNGTTYKYGLCQPKDQNVGEYNTRNNGIIKGDLIREYTFSQLLAELGGSTIQYFKKDFKKDNPRANLSYIKEMVERYDNLLKVGVRQTRKIPRKTATIAKKQKPITKLTIKQQRKNPPKQNTRKVKST